MPGDGGAQWAGEGVDLASQVKPHLVILDLHMPEMSGMEALDAL